MISDRENIVFTGLLIEYKNLFTKREGEPPQIMLFLNKNEIKIFKFERSHKAHQVNIKHVIIFYFRVTMMFYTLFLLNLLK